ncbi:hypothetical protein ACIGCZ_37135 [Streptomyces nigra]|uniref:hypothetical protein n=1 Tax=Streptomyces nigra TaxID=1827580 RepID=UPI0037D18049
MRAALATANLTPAAPPGRTTTRGARMHIHPHRTADVAPHRFARHGWRWWLCRHCYEPRNAHPTRQPVTARDADDNRRQP